MNDYKPFAESFITSFAPEILRAYLREAEKSVAGTWISVKCLNYIFSFFTDW